MSVTREDIQREARKLVGVPFKHQHSDPATGGLDCRGLLEYLGFVLYERPIPLRDYQRKPSGREFYEKLAAEMDEIPVGEAREGDVVMIQFPRDDEPRHAGVLVKGPFELMIIHAFERDVPGAVVEEPYRGWPRKCTRHAFRFRGLAD